MTSRIFLAPLAAAILLSGCASTTKPGAVGVTRQQVMLVSSATVERMALTSYAQQAQQAKAQDRLITSGPEYDRLLRIADRLKGQVGVFREDTRQWKWQLMLIDSPLLNATCAPGGKVTFYTGIVRRLKLTDDEIAAIMGHEFAHALREHGRERVSQAVAQQAITAGALAATQNSQAQVALANQFAQYLFVLPNSRQNESEADSIGLELAARAGYDPRAAISLWQKMAAAADGKSPPEFFSTHPASATRISEISAMLPTVLPLYEAASRH
ncbi:M48 family metallopeptidase [Noviherbaspirillum aerium]|uniref:M48 family metallopeptidase n=1 Tax=Noviherbaspirillum aerium TaxID=2588497 RepID=UPI00124EBF1F|nr:M48 family metallopeptidase [Noviherbaspirillum aerium]